MWAGEFAFLTSSPVTRMLLVQGPRFENHSTICHTSSFITLAHQIPGGMKIWRVKKRSLSKHC